MARSKCPSCSTSNFELALNTPRGSNYKVYLLQCSSCGAVVSHLPFFDAATMIDELEKKLDQRLNAIEQNQDTINRNIQVLADKVNRLK